MTTIRDTFTAIKADETKSPADKLYAMAKEIELESGKSFEVAFMRACESEPELHREYLRSNGTVGA